LVVGDTYISKDIIDLIFKERPKLNIKTRGNISKLLYCDHFTYFVLEL
jgi:hypothetical protein